MVEIAKMDEELIELNMILKEAIKDGILFKVQNNERVTGIDESNSFFKSDILFDKIKPKSKNKRISEALNIAKDENWRCIAENHYIIPNRVIKKGIRGDLKIPLFSFQNEKTLEVCKNTPLDGGGAIKTRDDIFNWFSSLKSLNYAKLYCKFFLKEEFHYYIDVKKSPYSIINDNVIKDIDISEYGIKNSGRHIREDNLLKIVFPIMYGANEIESIDEAYCLVTKRSLKSYIFGKNVFEYSLHHTCTKGTESVLKLKIDSKKVEPSTSLLNQNLINEYDLIEDIFNTQIISSGIHKTIHNSGVQHQGFDIFAKSQIPYIARSESNYNEILEYLKLPKDRFDNYYDYYRKNCNKLTKDSYKNKNRVKGFD